MSKKFGKFLLFTTVAGAAAYGAYHYLQTKDNSSSNKNEDTDDDFDDFSEDLDDDTEVTKERSYVALNLDKAEAIASEAFHKAKEVIGSSVQQVKDTVKSVTENQVHSDSNFTDLTALNKEQTAKTETPQEASDSSNTQPVETADAEEKEAGAEPSEAPAADAVSSAADTVAETVEEFFDDEM